MSKNFWETERLLLRAVEPDDWEVHYHWDMDSDMMRNLSELYFPHGKASVKKWAEDAALHDPTGDKFHMEIELKVTQEVIGVLSGKLKDRRSGHFEYGIAIRDDFKRNGYATEAILCIMRFYFDEMRCQKCTVQMHGLNLGSIKLHEALGFIKEGEIRRAIYTMGTYHANLYYGMTIEEYHERYN